MRVPRRPKSYSSYGKPMFGLSLSLGITIPDVLVAIGQPERIEEIKRVRFPVSFGESRNKGSDGKKSTIPNEHWVPHDDIRIILSCRPNREEKALWEMAQSEHTTIDDYLSKITEYPDSYKQWSWSRTRPEWSLEEYRVTNAASKVSTDPRYMKR